MSNVRLRLKRGDSEVEIEGSRSDVDELLRAWWSIQPEGTARRDHAAIPRRNSVLPRQSSDRASKHSLDERNPSFDALTLANAFKEDPSFSKFEKLVLHKSDMYNKIALVLTKCGDSLTSGQIASVLTALDVKADIGFVSNCIKRNSGKFLPTTVRRKGGTKPQYKLTSQARTAFEAFLTDAKD